ncbi:MAG TPA: glycosyltransferase family 4 protein, partial [Dehalococcoidia bacterium]|nr:glycosyltransferase family 4 protein [Dehalococcoidia bacterium]
RYEAALARRVDHLMAVSDQDARGLAALTGRSVTVVPNGIDCDDFAPRPGPPSPPAEGETRIRPHHLLGAAGEASLAPPRLVFCATFDYRPNVDAAVWLVRAILPRVWAVRPDVRLTLVGRSPAPAVRALAGERVEVTGYVLDIRPRVWESDLYVVPLRAGGGTRFKVLEGLALGVPVLTTSLGAEGIGGQPGEHYLVADGAPAFASAILSAIDDGPRRRELIQNGRQFVRSRYDWSVITPRLLDLYEAARPLATGAIR